MNRMRVLGAALLALPCLTLLAGPALATTPEDVARDLRTNRVYVDPDISTQVDVARVRDAAERAGVDVYVAILPKAAADANGGRTGINARIGPLLGRDAVLITAVGRDLTGGAGCGVGLDEGEADQIVRAGSGSAQSAILSAIDRLDQRTDGGTLDSGCSDASSGGGGLGTGGIVALGLLGAAVVGGGTALYVRGKRRRAAFDEADRADVESLYARLANEVSTLSPGDDPVARQALADAAERYNATGAAMATADSGGEWAAARRTAVEGLTAARLVRTRLGLDPGPEIPPPPGVHGPQLTAPQQVRVGDETYDGRPDYAPGHAHHYGGGTVGGQSVPGGWYPSRFWEGLLLGGLLTGGFGGGSDRDDRYDDDRGHGGGVSGGGGSGDWGGGGSGGGDWGGSSGGGGGGGKGDW